MIKGIPLLVFCIMAITYVVGAPESANSDDNKKESHEHSDIPAHERAPGREKRAPLLAPGIENEHFQ